MTLPEFLCYLLIAVVAAIVGGVVSGLVLRYPRQLLNVVVLAPWRLLVRAWDSVQHRINAPVDSRIAELEDSLESIQAILRSVQQRSIDDAPHRPQGEDTNG